LTGQLLPGDNLLSVIVDGRWLDAPPDALRDALRAGPGTIDYLQPAGIYRDVTLQVVPPAYLADVFARPADVLDPQRTVRVTATIDAAPGYLTARHPHYQWTDPPSTLANQAVAHAHVHHQARADPRYAGLLGWTGFDYYAAADTSTPGAAAKNWHTIRTPGVMDVFRVAKPGAATYRSQTVPGADPVIIPVFCWDDRFPPGADAMFATNCERLVLSVGGIPWLTVTPDRDTFGHLPCPPAFADLTAALVAGLGTGRASGGATARVARPGLPDLVIDGYIGRNRVATLRMTASSDGDRLELSVADATIDSGGTDATAFTIRATDAYGNRRPGIAGDVTLALTGPGTLIAENPFPLAAFGGVGGGFIRSLPGAAGRVTLTATHPTLGRARAAVRVSRTRSESWF
jgi:beta-galactosidase